MRIGYKKKKILIFIFLISPFFVNVNSVEEVKSSSGYSQHPILFLHGWTGDASVWNAMKDRFYNDGWPSKLLKAFTFSSTGDYSPNGNIQNAERIKYWVDDILNYTGAEKVDLIAHSMGGLSSRYYIKFLGGINKVDDYVCMGSPHHGVPGGTKVFQPNCTFLYNLNDGDETPGGILNNTIGPRVDVIGGAIYNGTYTAGNINYTSIYSNGDTICSPYITSRLDGANNIEVDGIEHIAMLYDESLYTIIKHAVYDDLSKGNNNNSSIPGYNFLILLGLVSLFSILIIKSQKIKI